MLPTHLAARHPLWTLAARLAVVLTILTAIETAPVPHAAAAPTGYAAAVLADAPAAYWRLDDTATTAADSSGHHHDGQIAPDAARLAAGALVGEKDGALARGATSPVMTAPASGLPTAASDQTVELWVKNTLPSESGCVEAPYVLLDGVKLVAFSGCADAGLGLTDSAGTKADVPDQLSLLADGFWHQVAYTYDAAARAVGLYVDGSPIGTATGVTLVPGAAGLSVLYGGAVDELAVYPAALTAERINAHFTAAQHAGSPCPPSPTSAYGTAVLADHPAAYFPLDEPTTDRVALAASGGCHDGARADDATSTTAAVVGGGKALRAGTAARGLTVSPTHLPAADHSHTVEMWVRGTITTQGPNCDGASYLALDALALELHSGCGDAGLALRDGSSVLAAVPDQYSALLDGVWHQVGYSYDATSATVVLYLDGVAIGRAGGVHPAAKSGALRTTYDHEVDEVSVYPGVLDPRRLAAHFTAGLRDGSACAPTPTSAYGTAVLADAPSRYYPLDEPTGARVALDASPSCLNGSRAPAAMAVAGATASGGSALGADSRSRGLAASSAGLPGPSSSQTIEAWVKGAVAPGSTCGGLPILSVNGLQLAVSDGCLGEAALRLFDGSTLAASAPDQLSVFGDGAWHQVAMTYDAPSGLVALYADGVRVTLATGVHLVGGSGQLRSTTGGSIDEVAVYPQALTGARIAAHFAQARAAAGTNLAGRVTFSGQPVGQSVVEACRAGGACSTVSTDAGGHYSLAVPAGDYAVTARPPAQGTGSDGGRTTASVTVGAALVTVDLELVNAALPPGTSVTGPGVALRKGIPVLTWGVPTVYTTTGCKGGRGIVGVFGVDQGSGKSVRRFFAPHESPAGSGTYVAALPPLAPVHGDVDVVPSVSCTPTTSFLPTGGDAAGGTVVAVTLGGGEVATGFRFGTTEATFRLVKPGVYAVTAPAGAGDVDLVVVLAGGATRRLGTFHYAHVDAAPASAAPGAVVPITGTGFTSQSAVLVGTQFAPKVTYVSPTRLDVTMPPGGGTQRVTVLTNGGATAPVTVDLGKIVVGGIKYTQGVFSASGLWSAFIDSYVEGAASSEFVGLSFENLLGLGLGDGLFAGGFTADVVFGSSILTPGALPILIGATIACVLGNILLEKLEEEMKPIPVLVDPSGTVVDKRGTPVSGAVATVERKGASGAFAAVLVSSGTIDPPVNPETTGSDGGFHWDVTSGTYRVSATAGASGSCTTAGGGPATAQTEPFDVPPPKLGIVVTLPCTLPLPPAPTVTAVSPALVSADGGDVVALSGTDLAGTTKVNVGGKAAAFTVLSAYGLRVTVPAGSGSAPVVVTTASGASKASSASTVTYRSAAGAAAPAATTTTAMAAPASATFGGSVEVTAKVASATAGVVPRGPLTVREGSTVLGTATVGADGAASVTLKGLAGGKHTLTAAYGGDGATGASSGSVVVTIAPAATTTTVSATADGTGSAVLKAVVRSAAGTPSGTVTFAEGTTSLGSTTLDDAGVATLTATGLRGGPHTITASYGGTGNWAASAGSVSARVTGRLVLTALPGTTRAGLPVLLAGRGTQLDPAARRLRIVETDAGGRVTTVQTCSQTSVCGDVIIRKAGARTYVLQALGDAGGVV